MKLNKIGKIIVAILSLILLVSNSLLIQQNKCLKKDVADRKITIASMAKDKEMLENKCAELLDKQPEIKYIDRQVEKVVYADKYVEHEFDDDMKTRLMEIEKLEAELVAKLRKPLPVEQVVIPGNCPDNRRFDVYIGYNGSVGGGIN